MEPKPILLNVAEVRCILQSGKATIRRRVRNVPIALKPRVRRVGDVLWVREPFACKLVTEGEQLQLLVKVRYAADGPDGVPRFIPPGKMGGTFHTLSYRSHPPEYMPKALARLTVKVTAATVETDEDGSQVNVLTLQLKERSS